MKQHPIPQNILDIEFKLFTKFTIREFIYMAVGIGFGSIFLLLYTRATMPGFIAFPIFLISSGVGLFLGLVPINDQNADIFLKNYILAITRPTQRVWKSEQFDEKVNWIAEGRGVDLTVGTMDRDVEGTEGKATRVVGGTAKPLPNDQFLEESKLTELELEEAERLREIERIAMEEASSNEPQPILFTDQVTETTKSADQSTNTSLSGSIVINGNNKDPVEQTEQDIPTPIPAQTNERTTDTSLRQNIGQPNPTQEVIDQQDADIDRSGVPIIAQQGNSQITQNEMSSETDLPATIQREPVQDIEEKSTPKVNEPEPTPTEEPREQEADDILKLKESFSILENTRDETDHPIDDNPVPNIADIQQRRTQEPKVSSIQTDRDRQPAQKKRTSSIPSQNSITISKDTVDSYKTQVEGYAPQPGNISLYITDRQGNPIPQAMTMVKDRSGSIIQVYVADPQGLITPKHQLEKGVYNVEIKHDRHAFPAINYILEDQALPVANIKSLT